MLRCTLFLLPTLVFAFFPSITPAQRTKEGGPPSFGKILELKDTNVQWVAFSPDGTLLASTSRETVKVWDAVTGQNTLTFKAGKAWPLVVFSPDGKRLAAGINDKPLGLKILDLDSGKPILNIEDRWGMSNAVFSPDGKRFAYGTWLHNGVKVRDAKTGQVILTLPPDGNNHVACVAYSPDGQRLASGLTNGTLIVWDAQTGKPTLTLKGHQKGVYAVAFSPDGTRLASLDSEEMKLWDLKTGRPGLTIRASFLHMRCLAFSPDGNYLASGRWSPGAAVLWDASTGKEAMTLLKTQAFGVAFSSNGRRFACGHRDGVTVWEMTTSPGNN